MGARESGQLVHLPSGRRVRVATAVRPAPRRSERRPRVLFAETREVLSGGALSVTDADTRTRLEGAALEELWLADFHVLRDFALRSGLLASEPEEILCENCDAPILFDGATLAVSDLADRYRGVAMPSERVVPLAAPIAVPGGTVRGVRMRPVTLREATPLHRELSRERAFRITPALVRALGIVSLEGTSRIAEPRLVARHLAASSDEDWSAVEEGFLSLAYPENAIAPVACPRCDTVHELEVPWPRELEPSQYHPVRDADAPFPDAEAFEAHVERAARPIFDRLGVPGLVLRVSPDVADVDAGGIPMLGSYGPESTDDGRTEFVVTLYHRTFERSFRDDPRFDWVHEVEETLEHEAQHHLYYLDGHDPMDEAERAETRADAARRAGGAARLRALERAALLLDAWRIVRVLGPILLGLAALAWLVARCGV